MKIYLVGMPGSGKTTLGKQLAYQLAMPFVDLDVEIEKSVGKKIPAIFTHEGEEYFRKIESDLLSLWAQSSKEFVMATGGGAPCYHHGMEVINKSGFSIFLDVPIHDIVERLKNNHERPLLAGDLEDKEQKLIEIAKVRMPCYRKAKIIVQKPTVDDVMAAIHFKR